MAVFDLFRNTKNRIEIVRFSATNKTPRFTPDSTLSMTHTKRTAVTSFPIEDGSKITDNIVNENDLLDMECVVTESPLILNSSLLTTGITAFTGFLPPFVQGAIGTGSIGAITAVLDSSKNRALDSFLLLEEIRKGKEIISIQTGFTTYSNMVITNIVITENVLNELSFRLSAEQISYATSKYVTAIVPLSRLADDIKHTGTKKADTGKDSTSSLDVQTDKAVRDSYAYQLKEVLKRYLK